MTQTTIDTRHGGHATPLEAAKALAPLIREHADQAERERRLPLPVDRVAIALGQRGSEGTGGAAASELL